MMNRFIRTARLVIQTSMAAFCLSVMPGCALFQTLKPAEQSIDCTRTGSSCHSGRFNAVWTSYRSDPPQQEAFSGRYEWQSGITTPDNSSLPRALRQQNKLYELQLTSALGPALAYISADGRRYSVKLADGRLFEADDWQSLFNIVFPMGLPAEPLVSWFERPDPTQLPVLPNGWRWTTQGRRIQLNYNSSDVLGRIDLLPDAP